MWVLKEMSTVGDLDGYCVVVICNSNRIMLHGRCIFLFVRTVGSFLFLTEGNNNNNKIGIIILIIG